MCINDAGPVDFLDIDKIFTKKLTKMFSAIKGN